jgi:hypothetical protein
MWRLIMTKGYNVSDAEKASIIADYREGLTVGFIATEYNRGTATVIRVLRAAGITVETKKYKTRKKYQLRECLKCGRPFKSTGIHNRICGNCNDTNQAYNALSYMKETIFRPTLRGRLTGAP